MEKAKINLIELIEKVTIFHDNDFKYTIKHNQSHWKSSTDNYFGSCYTFITPQIQTERKKPLQRIGFYMKRSDFCHVRKKRGGGGELLLWAVISIFFHLSKL